MNESYPTPEPDNFFQDDSPQDNIREIGPIHFDYFTEPGLVPDSINPSLTTPAEQSEIPEHSIREELCLTALLDLKAVQPDSSSSQDWFFEEYNRLPAPDDLATSLLVWTASDITEQEMNIDMPDGYEIMGGVSVRFSARERIEDSLVNIDFVHTGEKILALKRQLIHQDGSLVSVHTRRFTDNELRALQIDAERMRQEHIDIQLEHTLLVGMGPIVEESAEDGTRRFHVGDILTVMTGGISMSPRDSVGDNDIVAYMTGEQPNITQTNRFIQECQPLLAEQYKDLLGPIAEEIVANRPWKTVDAARYLQSVITLLGTTLLPVGKLDPSQHAMLSPEDEAALDSPNATILGNIEMPERNEDEDR